MFALYQGLFSGISKASASSSSGSSGGSSAYKEHDVHVSYYIFC